MHLIRTVSQFCQRTCTIYSFFDRVPATTKEQVIEPLIPPTQPPPADTFVKHIHFVNEKRDVALQISRSDFPSSSNSNKSAQTRWTSTKTHPTEYHHSKGRYLRTMEDPSLDDLSIASYRPPPLYFNSNSEFLRMMTPATTEYIDEAKENRLSYLASIPIASFNDEIIVDDEDEDNHEKQPGSKSAHTVRFNLPSSSSQSVKVPQTKIIPKQQLLATDFLHNFPLLRSLVEEALALQQHQYDMPTPIQRIMFDERPRSAQQQGQRKLKQSPMRPKSATNIRSFQTKSVIVTRNINNTRRLYPPPPSTRQNVVTKTEVRDLVDRLSKPKFNKRLERQIAFAEHVATVQEPVLTPRLPPKPASAPVFHIFLFIQTK
jgi:hypothetical protein